MSTNAQYKKGYLEGYADAEKAYGKCHLCYGKGYATQMRNEVGAEDFGGEGYETGPFVQIRPCSCERGKQVIEMLKQHEREVLEIPNGLLRSAASISARNGVDTNWEGWHKNLKKELEREHKIMYPEI